MDKELVWKHRHPRWPLRQNYMSDVEDYNQGCGFDEEMYKTRIRRRVSGSKGRFDESLVVPDASDNEDCDGGIKDSCDRGKN